MILYNVYIYIQNWPIYLTKDNQPFHIPQEDEANSYGGSDRR